MNSCKSLSLNSFTGVQKLEI